MKTRTFTAVFSMLMVVCLVAPAVLAQQTEGKMVGVVETITMTGPDAATATVILKDTKSDERVEIVINDTLTLDKLKDHRITEGDEIRCKYVTQDGKNVSTYFRKTAGC